MRVQTALRSQFGSGQAPTLPETAARVRSIARTLQRRLTQEGMSFSELLDVTRREVACDLAREGSSAVSELAWHLGFSEAAAFGRAFRRWTGELPAAYRKRHARK